jgi:hypothetical protein
MKSISLAHVRCSRSGADGAARIKEVNDGGRLLRMGKGYTEVLGNLVSEQGNKWVRPG